MLYLIVKVIVIKAIIELHAPNYRSVFLAVFSLISDFSNIRYIGHISIFHQTLISLAIQMHYPKNKRNFF